MLGAAFVGVAASLIIPFVGKLAGIATRELATFLEEDSALLSFVNSALNSVGAVSVPSLDKQSPLYN